MRSTQCHNDNLYTLQSCTGNRDFVRGIFSKSVFSPSQSLEWREKPLLFGRVLEYLLAFGPDFWIWLLSLTFESGFWVWLLTLAFDSGFWVWLLNLAFESDFWIWLLSLAFDSGFWLWLLTLAFGSGFWVLTALDGAWGSWTQWRHTKWGNFGEISRRDIQGRSPSGFWSGSRSGCNANHPPPPPPPSPTHNNRCTSTQSTSMCMYCRSALHMVGVGNQASSPSSKNTLRTIVLRSKFFYWFPGIREPPLATRLDIHVSD